MTQLDAQQVVFLFRVIARRLADARVELGALDGAIGDADHGTAMADGFAMVVQSGAEAAARHYHGISAAQLGPEQAARLAGMVPNPRFYDRNRNAPGLGRKTAIILGRMPGAEIP